MTQQTKPDEAPFDEPAGAPPSQPSPFSEPCPSEAPPRTAEPGEPQCPAECPPRPPTLT
jgi:hypothetical protein